MAILKIVGGIVLAGAVIVGVVAHEIGAYIDDVYDHEDWWDH